MQVRSFGEKKPVELQREMFFLNFAKSHIQETLPRLGGVEQGNVNFFIFIIILFSLFCERCLG